LNLSTTRATLNLSTTRATAAPFQGAAKTGVYVACVLVFVLHACLCLCRLLQRGQHDDACLLVFVMHACSCLCRLLQRGLVRTLKRLRIRVDGNGKQKIRVLLNSVFPGWTLETAGTDGLLGFLFCSLTPQFGLWTELHVRSSAWSLNLAGCM
jgi:hypothetical protein